MCIRDSNNTGNNIPSCKTLAHSRLSPFTFTNDLIAPANLRGMLGVKRINKVRNERIREWCGVKKGVNERINESMLRWFGHVERMNESRLVKRMYSGECVG